MGQSDEKKAQEIYMEFQAVEQHIRQLQQHLEIITSQLIELDAAGSSLEEFRNITAAKELFVPLSSGIFAKASIKDASEVLVNVGANVAVKKDIDSAKRLVQSHIEEVRKAQRQVAEELERMASHAARLEIQLQAAVQGKNS